MDATPANQLRVAAKRIKGSELLIVATNIEESVSGLNLYRKRWGIECLFADAKTRGLNIEDTHITDPDKLATSLVLLALALSSDPGPARAAGAARPATCTRNPRPVGAAAAS